MTVTPEPYSGTAADWDAFVRRQAGWTHFHLYRWRRVIESVFGHACPYFATRNAAGELTGVLPLVRVRSVLFGHYLVSMPFLNYGGPLGSGEAVRALAERAVGLAREGGVKLLELRSRIELPLELPASHRKITVVLDLPAADPEVLWKQLDAKVRSQVRRPQKEGITVRFGPDQVLPFYRVFSEHMRDLGTPTLPLTLFRSIVEAFPDEAWFGCAYHGKHPVACGAGFRWGSEFEMTWASSLSAYNKMAPNMLLYWTFIERAVREGLTLFNFGRCSPDAGTHRFKRQWGSRDEQLWWYQHSSAPDASTPSPDDGRYSWGPRLWQRLPLRLANVLGPRIVRYIP